MHTIIHGLDIDAYAHNIHIENSFLIESTQEMGTILTILKVQTSNIQTPFNHRTTKSMINEWIAHNNLYKLGFKQNRTKSVDINYPQPWYMPFIYWLTSRIVL